MSFSFHPRSLSVCLLLLVCGAGSASAQTWTLDSCLTRSFANHPELHAADREIDAARARVHQARALEPPIVSYEAGRLGTSVSGEERDESWRLSQGFPPPGQRSRTGALAALDADLAGLDREVTRLRIRGDVIRTYRRLQADRLTVRSLESLQGTTRGIEELTNVRLGTGAARYLDVLRARVERARLENDLVEARRSLGEHRRALNLLMARDPEAPLDPADSLAFVPLQDSLPSLLAEARRIRPRVHSAALQVRRETASLSLARSQLLPSTEIAFGWDRVAGSSTPGIGGSLALALPLAPWTDRRARITEAQALGGAARARLEAAERSLETAVRTAFEGARAAEARAATFERTLVSDATDAVRSATRGYEYGQVDGTDLFESLRTLRTVQLERIRALLDYELALVDLQTAE